MITVPERNIQVIDQMDRGMDLLKLVWLATTSRDCNETVINSIAAVLERTIVIMEPVREAVNKAHGDGRI